MHNHLIVGAGGQADNLSGSIAQRLLAGNLNPNVLRTNAVLSKDQWEVLDTAIVTAARERLVVVNDMIGAGMEFRLENGFGTTIVQHETQSEMRDAEVTMDAITRSQKDRVDIELVSTPVPVFHRDFGLSIRHLNASRRSGIPMDTTLAAEAGLKVAEQIENVTINGLASGGLLSFGGKTAQLQGLLTHPNRNTVTLVTNWDDGAKTGEGILSDVTAMLAAARADFNFGPFNLYVPGAYESVLDEDFKANSDKTIIQRLEELKSIGKVTFADKLPADNVLLIQMSARTADIVVGVDMMVVEWESEGGMLLNFKVLAIMTPRIKPDANGNLGIVHLSA